jgi:hypothetical protein
VHLLFSRNKAFFIVSSHKLEAKLRFRFDFFQPC